MLLNQRNVRPPEAMLPAGADLSQHDGVSFADCVFQQPWWLDAVAPGAWEQVTVESGGTLRAFLPFVRQRRWRLTVLTQPPLTPFLGPCFAPSPGAKASTLASQREQLARDLHAKLPPHDLFRQTCHYVFDDWLPFHWLDYRQTTRYSHVIDYDADATGNDALWDAVDGSVRKAVRKARKELVVRFDRGLDALLPLLRATYSRQGMALPFSEETVLRLDEACGRRNARQLLVAEDAAGRVHGALYIVWDQSSAYSLLSGIDPALRASGAMSLLTWTAVEFSRGVTQRFDFEGSMIRDIAHFFRSFGGRLLPYSHLTRSASTLGRLVTAATEVIGAEQARRLLRRG